MQKEFLRLFSSGAAYELRDTIENDPSLIGKDFSKFILFSDDADLFYKFGIDNSLPESERRLNDREITWLNGFKELGLVEKDFQQTYLQMAIVENLKLQGSWELLLDLY